MGNSGELRRLLAGVCCAGGNPTARELPAYLSPELYRPLDVSRSKDLPLVPYVDLAAGTPGSFAASLLGGRPYFLSHSPVLGISLHSFLLVS